jgi:hypothetical protein
VRLDARYGGEVFWALPSAMRRLKSSMRYYARGFELDEAIREAH